MTLDLHGVMQQAHHFNYRVGAETVEHHMAWPLSPPGRRAAAAVNKVHAAQTWADVVPFIAAISIWLVGNGAQRRQDEPLVLPPGSRAELDLSVPENIDDVRTGILGDSVLRHGQCFAPACWPSSSRYCSRFSLSTSS